MILEFCYFLSWFFAHFWLYFSENFSTFSL